MARRFISIVPPPGLLDDDRAQAPEFKKWQIRFPLARAGSAGEAGCKYEQQAAWNAFLHLRLER